MGDQLEDILTVSRPASVHVVVTLKAKVAGNLVPLLLIQSPSGDVSPLLELLDLSVNLINGSYSFDDVRALNATIGRYADLYAAVSRWAPVDAKNLVHLAYLYADFRLHGSVDANNNDPTGLGWQPVKWSSLENDLRHLKQYSEWCSAQYEYFPLLPTVRVPAGPEALSVKALATLERMRHKDFMVHLAQHRARWKKLLPQQERPKISVRRQQRRRRGLDEALEESFVHDLIEQEKNLVYRALWIMAAWGGVRISEQLNQWTCDVLPGASRAKFFRGDPDTGTPLVLIADPWESTWCGSYSDRRTTRTQYLMAKHRLLPRPDLGPVGSSLQADWVGQAGFKGIAFHNAERLVSQVLWLDPAMASEYSYLAQQMIGFHTTRGITNRHPWLWVVTDPRKPNELGNPIKISSVESAFARACSRLGVRAHEGGRSLHGLRHFYKAFAQNRLGLGADIIQFLMHHRSRESQQDYGWEDSVRIRNALTAGYQKIKQTKALSTR